MRFLNAPAEFEVIVRARLATTLARRGGSWGGIPQQSSRSVRLLMGEPGQQGSWGQPSALCWQQFARAGELAAAINARRSSAPAPVRAGPQTRRAVAGYCTRGGHGGAGPRSAPDTVGAGCVALRARRRVQRSGPCRGLGAHLPATGPGRIARACVIAPRAAGQKRPAGYAAHRGYSVQLPQKECYLAEGAASAAGCCGGWAGGLTEYATVPAAVAVSWPPGGCRRRDRCSGGATPTPRWRADWRHDQEQLRVYPGADAAAGGRRNGAQRRPDAASGRF